MCIRQGKVPVGISINSSLTTQQLDILYQTVFPTDLPFNEDKIIDESDVITANGYKGIRFDIVQNETDEEDPSIVRSVKGREFWIPSGSDMFLLEYLGGSSTFDLYLPIAEQMMDSFKLLSDNPSTLLENPEVNQPGFFEEQDRKLKVYDSEFFSIKYPASWYVGDEIGVLDIPGASGVTLLNQIDPDQGNRITPRSFDEDSIIAVSRLPQTVFPIDASNFDASEILDSFIAYR